MNLRVMSLMTSMRYSAVPAADTTRPRLTVDRSPQIPRRTPGSRLQRGLTYRDGLRLDLHRPASAGPHPLVVFVPGGGFVVAPRRMGGPQRAYLAAAGYVVASIEYRTVRQKATCADGVADIQAAITYLTDRAGTYGIDPDRIGLWGESAGGYLAGLAGLTDGRIRAVVDQFGASDLSRVADGFDARMRRSVTDPGHPIQRYGADQANLADLAHAAAPAFLLLHGDDDRVISPVQSELLHRALLAGGADSTYHLLAGAGHGPLALTRRQARQWTSVQLQTIIRAFLDRHLAVA